MNSLPLSPRFISFILRDFIVKTTAQAAVFPVKSRKKHSRVRSVRGEMTTGELFILFVPQYLPCLLSPYSARLCALCDQS